MKQKKAFCKFVREAHSAKKIGINMIKVGKEAIKK